MEVVSNICAVARRIYRSGGDEWLGTHDVQQGNLIVAVGNIFRRVGDWSPHEEKSAGEECEFGVFYVQIVAVADVDAEWNKRRPLQ
jgi:hypothetical protein